MGGDVGENYEGLMEGLELIKDVGVEWDERKYVEGEGGEYVRIGGGGKGSSKW